MSKKVTSHPADEFTTVISVAARPEVGLRADVVYELRIPLARIRPEYRHNGEFVQQFQTERQARAYFTRAGLARMVTVETGEVFTVRSMPAAYKRNSSDVIPYRIQQLTDGKVWTSGEFKGDHGAIWQNIVAGFLIGQARWAVDLDGLILFGIDGQGNRIGACELGRSNLDGIRAYALAHGGVWL